jgi:hypothetical protein
MDAQQTVQYLENERVLVSAISNLTKEVSRRYNSAHQVFDIKELNTVLKTALVMTFGIKREDIPDFTLNTKIHSVVLTLGDLATLVANITKSFDDSSGSKKEWKWS